MVDIGILSPSFDDPGRTDQSSGNLSLTSPRNIEGRALRMELICSPHA